MIFLAKSYLVTQTVGNNLVKLAYLTRPAFACSKQQWKHQKISEICSKLTIKTRTTSLTCIYCQLWTDFTQCFGVSIVDFEQVNAGWGTETYLEPCQTFMMESRYFYPLIIFKKSSITDVWQGVLTLLCLLTQSILDFPGYAHERKGGCITPIHHWIILKISLFKFVWG